MSILEFPNARGGLDEDAAHGRVWIFSGIIHFNETTAAESESTSVVFDKTAASESTVYEPPEPIQDPVLDESSIADPPAEESGSSFAVTFQIITDSTTKGRPKLIDSRGNSYHIKRSQANTTDWQCTTRP